MLAEVLNYPLQLEGIRFLQALVPDMLNGLFQTLHHFDSSPFYLTVATVGAQFLPSRQALGLAALLAVAILVNFLLKLSFDEPRPFILDPTLAKVMMNSTRGLPSGAAQGAMLIALTIHSMYPRCATVVFGCFYIALLSFSRIYLGVHFFTDLIGGWICGSMLFAGFCWVQKRSESSWKARLAVWLLIHAALAWLVATGMGPRIAVFVGCLAGVGSMALLPLASGPKREVAWWLHVVLVAVANLLVVSACHRVMSWSDGWRIVGSYGIGLWLVLAACRLPFGLSKRHQTSLRSVSLT